jgi:hypothetical protein
VFRLLLAVTALLGVVLATGTAVANERFGNFIVRSDHPDLIELAGPIDSRSVGDFHRALSAQPGVRVILLKSPGGYVDEALIIAAEVRQLGLNTAIPKGAGCYSACTYLFFAGREHVVRGSLGVHQVSEKGVAPGAAYDGDVRAALRRYGTPSAVLKAMSSTPSSSLHIFSAREIAKYALNRCASGSKTELYAER